MVASTTNRTGGVVMRNVLLAVMGLAAFAGVVTAAPVPKALLKKPFRAMIQPLPDEELYSVYWNDVPFEKVAEEVEELTGLYYLAKDVPEVNITLQSEKVCLPELVAQLDEILFPTGWVIQRKTQCFLLMPDDVPLSFKEPPHRVDLQELERRTPHEQLQMVLVVGDTGIEAGIALSEERGSGVRARKAGVCKLQVMGTGEKLRAFVAEMGDHIKK